MTTHHTKLYKIDSKGQTRVWWMEYDPSLEAYRTHAGIDGGKIVTSGWYYPEAKNVGRSNETSIAEQVVLEIGSEYEKKQNQGKYHKSIEQASSGAKFYECMLATKYDSKKHTNFPYYSQPKLDGVRCLVSKDGMQSRQGKPILSAPHILEALKPFFEIFPDVVLDGELYNHDLKDNFEKIISLVRKTKPTADDLKESEELVQYHVYDVIMDGPYRLRNEFLYNLDDNKFYKKGIQRVFSTLVMDQDQVQTMLAEHLEKGYEGQMLRVPDSPYEGKRSKFLIKHKEFEDEEFEIVSITEGNGNWAGKAKSIEIRLKDGTTQSSGVRGSYETLVDVLKNADQYIGGTATVIYQNKTEDGKLRFPVAKTLYKGKRDV